MHLRSRSALALATVTLSLSAICGWAVGHYLTVDAEREATVRAHVLAGQIAERIDLTVWAQAHELLSFSVATPLAEPDMRADHARNLLDQIQRTLPIFRWIGFVGGDGRIAYASGGEREGMSATGSAAFRQARAVTRLPESRGALISVRTTGLSADKVPSHAMDLAVPTFDAAGNRSGVLLAQLGGDWAADSIEGFGQAAGFGAGSEVIVIAADGRVVLSSNPQMIGRVVNTSMIGGSQVGTGWSAIRRWPDGEKYLTVTHPSTGYRDFAGFGWTVVLRQPLESAMGASATLARNVAIGAACVGALGLLVGWWLGFRWRRQPARTPAEASTPTATSASMRTPTHRSTPTPTPTHAIMTGAVLATMGHAPAPAGRSTAAGGSSAAAVRVRQ